jgi:uncharacterized protein involved in exopolysaccharide biosynthesis
MSLLEFYRLLIINLKWLILIPLIMGGLVVFMTRNGKKEYASSTLIYTGLASGYSITSDESSRVDYFAVNNAFDNILTLLTARETLEEVSMRLLATHISLDAADSIYIGDESFGQISEWLHPDEIALVKVSGDPEATYQNIVEKKVLPEGIAIKKLLNTPSIPYSLDYIREHLTVTRKSNSDMLELVYSTHDPGICQHTLQLLAEVFMGRYKGVKTSETMQVVGYFEEQVQKAQQRLKNAEDRLRDFGVENRIINYNEQTKFISEAKEELGKSRQEEEMALAQSSAALKKLESSLSQRTQLIESSDKILQLRQELSNISYRIAQMELQADDPARIAQMQEKAANLKNEIHAQVSRLYQINFTNEGLSQPTLLNEWMDNFLEVDGSRARIDVIDQRIAQFEKVYDDFAPLGSTLNQLEREVNVVEREYLTLLHGLNQAKLRQQNLEMSNNLKVIDGPYFPEKPKASKRAVVVVGSSVVSFILVLASLVVGHVLDFSMRTPQIAVSSTGLQLAGALPERAVKSKAYDLPLIQQIMMRHLNNRLRLLTNQMAADAICCALLGLGKEVNTAEVARLLTQYQQQQGEKVALITNNEADGDVPFPQKIWKENSDTPLLEQIDSFVSELKSQPAPPKKIFIVLPNLLNFDLPVHWLQKLDMSLVVVRSANVWSESDAFMLHNFAEAVSQAPLLILDEVRFENLESIMGEVPRKRNFVRRIFKKILMFQFK